MKVDMKQFKMALLVIALCFTSAIAMAQFGTEPPDQEDPNPTTEVPFDGGATILLAAGAAYGLKKIRDRRKKGIEVQENKQDKF
jgi:hypothetical protein